MNERQMFHNEMNVKIESIAEWAVILFVVYLLLVMQGASKLKTLI